MMRILNKEIGFGCRPFIIAEMSGNHNQSLNSALRIVDAAADAGVDALKIQTYTADTMTLDIKEREFLITNRDSIWHGMSLYDLYRQAHTPWEWHKPIFERCRERGIIGFSTPFDETAVDFLEELQAPCYKIASFENTDIPLIRKVAATGKPLIISTGMATVGELGEAVAAAKESGCRELALLKCTSTYPASPETTNILTIPHMRELFNCEVGLSDHTMGVGVAVAATCLGASVIEKHFTLCRADGGVDSTFSMEPNEMRMLVMETERAWQSLGKVSYGPNEKERQSLIFRRSIYVTKDVSEGEILTLENVKIIRPGLGLSPKHFNAVLGMHARKKLERGTPLSWDVVI